MEEEGVEQKSFTPSKGLTTAEAETLLEKYGRNELEEHVKPKVFFSKLFLHVVHVKVNNDIYFPPLLRCTRTWQCPNSTTDFF